MPSRIRIILLTRREVVITGKGAVDILRKLSSARAWPKVDFAALAKEGVAKGVLSRLLVWRERRGISNHASKFFEYRGLRGSHTRTVVVLRQAALARRIRPRSRSFAYIASRPEGRLLIPGDEPTRPISIGIFQ